MKWVVFNSVTDVHSDLFNLHKWLGCKKKRKSSTSTLEKVKDKEVNPYNLLWSVLTEQLHLSQLPFP